MTTKVAVTPLVTETTPGTDGGYSVRRTELDTDRASMLRRFLAHRARTSITGVPPIMKPVTLVIGLHRTGLWGDLPGVTIVQGRVSDTGASTGKMFVIPKGRRAYGFTVSTDKVLEVCAGYASDTTMDALAAEWVGRVAGFEVDDTARAERVAQAIAGLPVDDGTGDCPDMVSVVLLGEYRFLGQPIPGAMWWLTHRDPEDVVNGFLWLPDNRAGAVSETGSAYVSSLEGFDVVPLSAPIPLGHIIGLDSGDTVTVDQLVAAAV